jgi:predicted ATP-dependent endonuclease of OLD family
MYLSRLFISNYRSIDLLDLRFYEGKNVIVGKNNAGKSNIIKAIDLVLGENTPTYNKSENITINDFHNGDTSKDLIIFLELTRNKDESLNYESINKCYGYYVLGKKILGGREMEPTRYQLSDDYDELIRNIETILKIDFDETNEKIYVNPKLKNQEVFKNQLENKYHFAYIFSAKYDASKEKIEKDIKLLYRENETRGWIVTQKASIRNELLQSAIIPAFRDPQNQLRPTSYTWYGKLLQNYVDIKNSALTKAFQDVKKASDFVFEKLKEKVNDSRIKIAFPDTTISFQFNPETKQDVYKSALIYVDDGFNSLLQDKGSGIQSAVIIGLFDFYIRNVAHVSGSLLAIEEPELYLHPHGRRIISDRLEDFLEGKKNQVIITTHSSEFITSSEKDLNIILVKKKNGKTTARSVFFKDPEDRRLLLKGQNAEMFFADSVILVEGGEKYIFEVMAKKIGNGNKQFDENWLNNKNVSIISVSGKGEFLKYSKKLNELCIPWIVFADFDFIRRGISEFINEHHIEKNIIDELNSLKSDIGSVMGSEKEYKNILDIPNVFLDRIERIRDILIEKNIFIFSGELESFYKDRVNKECGGLTKEEKAICVASEIMTKNEEDFLVTAEIKKALNIFMERIIIENVTE